MLTRAYIVHGRMQRSRGSLLRRGWIHFRSDDSMRPSGHPRVQCWARELHGDVRYRGFIRPDALKE